MTTQQDSGLRQQATNAQHAQSNHNKGNTIMNVQTIATLRVAYNSNEFAPFVGAHHATIKAAVKHDRDRQALAAAMVVRGLNVPEWLMNYYVEAEVSVPEQVVAITTSRSVANKLVSSVTSQSAEMFKPLLLGASVREWAHGLSQTMLVNKEGNPYSAMYSATYNVNRAISDLNKRAYGAYLAGVVDQAGFEAIVETIRDRLATAAGAIAAIQRRNASTAGAEIMEIAVKTRDHAANGRGENRLAELNEQIRELNGAIAGGDFKPTDAQLAYDLLAERQEVITLRLMKEGESDEKSWSDSDASRPNDTGSIRAAIESFDHLYSLDPRDVFGAEEEATKALWAAHELSMPMTSDLSERIAEKWENAIDYSTDKQAAYAKCARRAALVENGVDATIPATTKDGREWNKPLAAQMRWVVNHITRSIWRDIKRLEMTREQYEERHGKLENAARDEEMGYTESASLTRVNMGETQELNYSINLPFIREIGNDDLPQDCTQILRMRVLYGTVISEIDETLPRLRELYAQWRELDITHAPIWATFSNESLPLESPPIYWNMKGWYMTQGEAEEALLDELAEGAQQRLIETADQAADMISELLEDNFNI